MILVGADLLVYAKVSDFERHDAVRGWLGCGAAWTPEPTDRHREVMRSLIPDIGSGANLVPDAHLAAHAIEHGLTLCSTDRDFARFEELRWEDPLCGAAGGPGS